jgi:hypothetical protein
VASLDVMTTYRVQLTPDEFRLLGDALRAMNTPEARLLNAALQELRAKHVSEMAKRCDHIATSAKAEAAGQ